MKFATELKTPEKENKINYKAGFLSAFIFFNSIIVYYNK